MIGDLWHDWRSLWDEATECLAELARDPDQVRAAKQYTEAHLTRQLLEAPLWRQAYGKPRGYPGDFEMMNYIYDATPVGDSAFARLAHALAVHIGEFVVRRKNRVRGTIADLIASRGPHAEVRIASLGSGPAREIVEYLTQNGNFAGFLTVTLIDQDEGALRFAGGSIANAHRARRQGLKLSVEPRKVSVLRLLRDLNPADLLSQPDMIYSAGLFDYFSDRTCRILTARLYAALRPGGVLLLGNMKAGTDMPWPLEFIADWSLTYRSAESVLSWTEGLQGAEIALRTEATGYDYALVVRKPA